MNVKRIFADDRTGPDAMHQFVFGDDFSRRPDKDLDDFERAPTDRDGRTKHPEFAASQVDLALARGVDQPNALFRHIRSP